MKYMGLYEHYENLAKHGYIEILHILWFLWLGTKVLKCKNVRANLKNALNVCLWIDLNDFLNKRVKFEFI